LKEDEKVKLHKIIAKRKSSQAKVLRARIILLDDEGLTVSAIASEFGIVKNTVIKWDHALEERFGIKRYCEA
jgi:transposase